MKTLLRRVTSGRYFEAAGKWTTNPEAAKNFISIDHALDFIATWHLKDVELAFSFGNSVDVTGVPIEKVTSGYFQI